MCAPALAVAAVAMAASTALQAKAANDARGQEQDMLNANTALSASEFDKREASQKANFEDQLGLSDTEFNKRLGVEQNQRQQSTDITDKAYGDATARQTKSDQDQAAALANYQALADASRQRQEGFQTQADSIVDQELGRFAPAARTQQQADLLNSRNGILQQAISAPVMPAEQANVSGATQAETAAQAGKYVGRVQTNAANGAKVASYNDLLRAGNQDIDKTNEGLSLVDLNAARDLSTLPYQLAPAQMTYMNAPVLARADIAQALGTANSRKATLEDYANKLIGSSADYEGGLEKDMGDYGNTLLGNSGNYEAALNGLTQTRINSLSRTSPIGSLLGSFGGSLFTAGLSNGGGASLFGGSSGPGGVPVAHI